MWIVRNVSVSISPGERVALVGPTGAGKTVLLRALALLDPLDEGEIFYRGEMIDTATIPLYRSRIVYLHQRPALAPGTVEETLREPFELRVHSRRRFDREGALALLRRTGRDESFLSRGERDLSGGERQLVALLRALFIEPDVLLLDEPTASVDSDTRAELELLVAEWRARSPGSRAWIWVTHDREQARRMADRIVRVDGGRVSVEP